MYVWYKLFGKLISVASSCDISVYFGEQWKVNYKYFIYIKAIKLIIDLLIVIVQSALTEYTKLLEVSYLTNGCLLFQICI